MSPSGRALARSQRRFRCALRNKSQGTRCVAMVQDICISFWLFDDFCICMLSPSVGVYLYTWCNVLKIQVFFRAQIWIQGIGICTDQSCCILKPFHLKSHWLLIPVLGSFRLVLKWPAKLISDQASTTCHGRWTAKTSSTESTLTLESLWPLDSQDSEDAMRPLEAHPAWCFQPSKSIGIITVVVPPGNFYVWRITVVSQSESNSMGNGFHWFPLVWLELPANFPTTWWQQSPLGDRWLLPEGTRWGPLAYKLLWKPNSNYSYIPLINPNIHQVTST